MGTTFHWWYSVLYSASLRSVYTTVMLIAGNPHQYSHMTWFHRFLLTLSAESSAQGNHICVYWTDAKTHSIPHFALQLWRLTSRRPASSMAALSHCCLGRLTGRIRGGWSMFVYGWSLRGLHAKSKGWEHKWCKPSPPWSTCGVLEHPPWSWSDLRIDLENEHDVTCAPKRKKREVLLRHLCSNYSWWSF